jgi:hypothetical protein
MKNAATFPALLAATICFVAGAARGDDRASATVLFDEGMALMKAGKFEQACRKLEASERLFQGIGTRANLAECYEKAGRLASSWSMYKSALSLAEAKADARVEELRRRIGAIEGRLSRLTITASSAKTPGLRVTRDGVEVPEGGWGVALPIDGGRYTFVASAPGFKSWREEVSVKPESDAMVVAVPPLDREAAPSSTSAKGEGPVLESGAASVAPADKSGSSEANSGATLRYGGLSAIGVGAVGLVAGGYFGIKAIGKKGDAESFCNGADCRTQQGVDDTNSAIDAAKLSTVFVSVGAVLVAGGTAMYFLAPSAPVRSTASTRWSVDAKWTGTTTGVSLRGEW